MCLKSKFRKVMAQRRQADPSDRVWLTKTARKLVWLLRKVPTRDWEKLESQYED